MIRRLMIPLRLVPMAARVHTALFVLLALPVGIVLAALVPLGQVLDEQAHVDRQFSVWSRGGVTSDAWVAAGWAPCWRI